MFNVFIPAHLLPLLLHGKRDGITEEEANDTAIFAAKFAFILPLPLEHYFTPKEGQKTHFCPFFNDVTATPAKCYIFAIPTGEEQGKEARQ